MLHTTDNTAGNWLGAAIIGVAAIVGLFGFGTWRFEPVHARGSVQLTPDVLKFLVIGVAAVALSIVVAAVMKSSYPTAEGIEDDLFFPFTKQGFRATAFLVLRRRRLHLPA